MNLKQKSRDFFRTLFPANGQEWWILLFFLAGYTSLASFIALNYRIVFDDRIPWDAYFSFDNRSIVLTGGGFERHPLSNYFFDQLRNLALTLSGNQKDAVFRLVLAVSSAIAVSFSILQIFKYLRNIIRLPLWLSWFLLLFFGIFSTNILLAFTPETYTYTLFLLCFYNYYTALKFKKEQPVLATALTFATVGIGGLTITNAAKVFLPVLVEKDFFKSSKKFLNAVVRSAVAVGVFASLYLYRLNFDFTKIFNKTGEQYEKFSNPKVTPLWDMIASWFFGGNFLFPGFTIRDYHNKKGFFYRALFMDVYHAWLPYVVVSVLLGLIIWSVVKNRREKLVQILAFSFLIDILIHCVLKFGLHTSYIYGGHFVFVYPLLLGWLFHWYRCNPRTLSLILGCLLLVFSFTFANNLLRMGEFLDFLNHYYR